MPSITFLYWIPLLPLVMAGLLAFFKPNAKRVASFLTVATLLACFFFSVKAYLIDIEIEKTLTHNFAWMHVGGKSIEFGVALNSLTSSMLLMVCFVGSLIFIYAGSYMQDDERKTRFFCYLNLFAAGMLGIIVSNSLLMLFMCWEIVGLASYLLIGFWYHKPSAAAAAQKAFITTRIGDMGFLIGILLAFKYSGTLLFYTDGGTGLLQSGILSANTNYFCGLSLSATVALLLFIGAIGKSGQLPLHVWLPDAMEGPTPVSALIHAATMVAAGVFLVARTFVLFEGSPCLLNGIAWLGSATMLFAAVTALGQYDIKRILAYSTVSQLGFMMVGLGTGGVAFGMFHLLTHAFFKALLFLGAGSLIHGCHHEQDIRKMGGLLRTMPLTGYAYLAGMLSLCAFPFTAGYFSKDMILLGAWEHNKAIFAVVAFSSFLTALYMTRQCLYVFFGNYRGHHHPHESPFQMILPILILAVFAIGGGFFAENIHLFTFLNPVGKHAEHNQTVVFVSWGVALGGMLIGYLFYHPIRLRSGKDPLACLPFGIYKLMENRFYIDEIYAFTVGNIWKAAGIVCYLFEELLIVIKVITEALVNKLARLCANFGDNTLIVNYGFDNTCEMIKRRAHLVTAIQTGQVAAYLRITTLGALLFVLTFWILLKIKI